MQNSIKAELVHLMNMSHSEVIVDILLLYSIENNLVNGMILVHTVNSLLQLVQNFSKRILTTTRLHMQYTALETHL